MVPLPDDDLGTARHDVLDALTKVAGDALQIRSSPPRLFHFTDTQGLIGIVQSKSIRGSLAMSLSDRSEFKFGLARGHEVLAAGVSGIDPEFTAGVLDMLDGKALLPDAFRVQLWPYVASFCGNEDSAAHWLHYGRSGTGFALGFDPGGFVDHRYDLAPVIYQQEDQQRVFSELVRAAWLVFQRWHPQLKGDDRVVLAAVAADAVAMNIRALAVRMKAMSFEFENEWRLVSYDAEGERVPQDPRFDLSTSFGSKNGRIVPFKTFPLETFPLVEIVMGTSVALDIEDAGLARLLAHSGVSSKVGLRRSVVDIRP